MSTMETRAPVLPSKLWSLPFIVLSSVAAYAVAFSESFSEALHMAHEAERRYPFCNW
ncbi:MAG TPA: hypothetical protein VE224_00800 [Pseudolabrys sp.]|nr:hypothetical protein [Pseudolabrys sp.]